MSKIFSNIKEETEIAAEYQKLFDNFIKNNTKIYNCHHEALELHESDIWTQAWADTPRRKWFPKYWFVRKQTGDVITFSSKDNPNWLQKDDKNRDGRIKYMFSYHDELKGKSDSKGIEIQNLNGLVHDAYAYGDAAKLLDLSGPWAFGHNKGQVNGHHRNEDKFNNDADNIEFVVQGSSHDTLTYQPKEDCSMDDFLKYAKKIGSVAGKEAPGKITIITAGDSKEIFSADIPAEDSPFMQSLRGLLAQTQEAEG